MNAARMRTQESLGGPRRKAGHDDAQDALTASVCICTRNRPNELRRALESIQASDYPVHQVVVADDSDEDRVRSLLEEHPLAVDYVKGPRRGLGANRNRALERVTGSHVLFLDDDAELGKDFLVAVGRYLQALPAAEQERTIVTGVEINSGRRIMPNEQGLLGFQNRPYKLHEPLRTFVINATLFPRFLFDRVQFDPLLVYGYDEVDVATQAVALGFVIIPRFEAANYHHPSAINRSEYAPFKEASRLYVTLKRRRLTEGSPVRAWISFGVAVCHAYLTNLKRDGFKGLRQAWTTTAGAYDLYRQLTKSGSPSILRHGMKSPPY